MLYAITYSVRQSGTTEEQHKHKGITTRSSTITPEVSRRVGVSCRL